MAQFIAGGMSYAVGALIPLVCLVLLWFLRDRSMRIQKRALRGLVAMAEDVLSAASAREIAEKVFRGMPEVVPGWEGEIYLLNRDEQQLVRIPAGTRTAPIVIPVEAAARTLEGAVAASFRNQSFIDIDDTRSSPLVDRELPDAPAAAILVPMVAQRDVCGVLVVRQQRRNQNWRDVKITLQHLANQVAISLQLQEQQQMREQLLRSEKLAAAGQLISAIANELRAPLESIRGAVVRVGEEPGRRSDLRSIESEADRGLDIIDHLISFSRMEQRHSRLLDIHDLIASLLEMRDADRARKGVRMNSELPVAPAMIFGDRVQLEQAMLTVLVHTEHSAAASTDRVLTVSSRVTDDKVNITFACGIDCRAADDKTPSTGDYFGLPVAQVIVQNHGGELRYISGTTNGARFELELPTPPDQEPVVEEPPQARPARVLTCLLVEPDPVAQRKLLSMLAVRGHRAIPVTTPEEGADLAQRVQFAAILCTARLPGLPWTEFYNRVRRRAGAFGLMAEAWETVPAHLLRDGEAQVLRQPITPADLDGFLALAEVRLAAARA